MAHLPDGIMGPVKGTIGDKVYFVRNGQQYVRSKSGRNRNLEMYGLDDCAAQGDPEIRMEFCKDFLKHAKEVIAIGSKATFKRKYKAQDYAARMLFQSTSIDDDMIVFDVRDLVLSDQLNSWTEGFHLPFFDVHENDVACVSWHYDPEDEYGREDSAALFVYNFSQDMSCSSIGEVRTADECHAFVLPDTEKGDMIAAWGFFLTADGNGVSKTCFLGMVKVE